MIVHRYVHGEQVTAKGTNRRWRSPKIGVNSARPCHMESSADLIANWHVTVAYRHTLMSLSLRHYMKRTCFSTCIAQRWSSTRPSSRPNGVSRLSALSARSSRRYSERLVSILRKMRLRLGGGAHLCASS